MAAAPKYKIYTGSRYVGAIKDPTDAVACAEAIGVSGQTTIRLGHSSALVVYRVTEQSPDSYDVAAEELLEAEREIQRRAHERIYGRK